MKICANCIYFAEGPIPSLHRCTFNPDVNLVTGTKDYKFCDIERSTNWGGRCGAKGKYYIEARMVV